MSDDLVKRLRVFAKEQTALRVQFFAVEAADRIAELEAALRDARARYIELDDKEAAEAMAKIINEALGDVK